MSRTAGRPQGADWADPVRFPETDWTDEIWQIGQPAVTWELILGRHLGQFGNPFPRVLQTFPHFWAYWEVIFWNCLRFFWYFHSFFFFPTTNRTLEETTHLLWRA